jgi:hypothetical protein
LVVVVAAAGCGEDPPIDVTCRPVIVYLNRDGGVFRPGAHDDAITNASVLLDAERTLAPWPKTDSEWDVLASCFKDHLFALPRLEVVTVDPGAAPHLEIVFTTSYWASAGTTAIVPASCRPDHEIELVFGDALATTARACDVALQEFAIMTANLSLDDDCHDLVNNFADCSPDRSFLDRTVNCVDDAARPTPCRCGGTTENTYRALATTFPPCS